MSAIVKSASSCLLTVSNFISPQNLHLIFSLSFLTISSPKLKNVSISHKQLTYLPANHSLLVLVKKAIVSPANCGVSVKTASLAAVDDDPPPSQERTHHSTYFPASSKTNLSTQLPDAPQKPAIPHLHDLLSRIP